MDDGGFPAGALHLDGLVGGEGGVFQGDGVEAGGVLHAVGQRSEVSPEGFSGVLGWRMSGRVQRKHKKLSQRDCVTAGRQVPPSGEFITTPVRLHKITTFHCLNTTQPVDFCKHLETEMIY